MSRQTIATIPIATCYDNCLISSCLKKLFTKKAKRGTEPAIIITSQIATVKTELEQLNSTGAPELSYAYLEAMEQSMSTTGFRYVMIYRNDEPVLFCYFQLISISSHNFSFDKETRLVKSILSFFLNLKKVKVLISGNALRIDTAGFCYNKSVLDNNEAAEIIAAAAERIADEDTATAVILRNMPISVKLGQWLNSIGYQAPWPDQVMTLDIATEWQTIGGYILALSRKYRSRANKILAARGTIAIRVLAPEDILLHKASIHRLFTNVTDSQPFVLTHIGADHFIRLKDVYKDNFELVGFFRNGKLVAFHSAFLTANAYELYYAGFDYDLNTAYQLYFNLLFSGLERAMQLGLQQLKLGRTAFDAKASMGAKPVETAYLVKTANIPNVAIKWFANYFSAMEEGKWKLRNPFK